MPEENKDKSGGLPNPTEHNEKVARQLAEQDIGGKSTVLTAADLADSGSALDKLVKKKDEEGNPTPDPTPAPAPSDTPPPTDDEAAKKAAEDSKKAEEAAKQREEDLKRAETFFKDTPSLSPNASPKSSEAFSSVKIKAAQEISARDSKIEELTKQLTEAQEKLKNPVPPETEKELSDLREWRAKLDVEVDPKFKEFDKSISQTEEFIYTQLRQSPVITDKVIDEIKKYGGPDKVDMAKLFEAIKDPTMQRLVESKIADIAMARFNKQQAIKTAKENISQYLNERQKTIEQSTNGNLDATKKQLSDITGKFEWFKEQKPTDKSTPEEKKAIEEHNKFVEDTRKALDDGMNDNTPEMRAIMLAGMAQLLYLQRRHAFVAGERDALKKQLAEATEKLEKLKSAGTSRMRESAAPAGGALPKPKESDIFTKRATESLDDLARQITETRARAAAGA